MMCIDPNRKVPLHYFLTRPQMTQAEALMHLLAYQAGFRLLPAVLATNPIFWLQQEAT